MYDRFTARTELISKITNTTAYEYTDSGTINFGTEVPLTWTIPSSPTIDSISGKVLNKSWTMNALVDGTSHSISKKSSESFSIDLNLTWALTAVTTMSYTLEGYNGGGVPDWVNLDSDNSKISGTIPSIDEDTNYYFIVKSSFDEVVDGNITKYIAIGVTASKNTTTAEEEGTQPAAVVTQITSGAVTALSMGSSIAAGRPSTGLWSFLEQQQIIILLLTIDSFIPLRIQKYLEGISFAMLNGINIRKPYL